jgi:hypothetical protein
MAPAEAKPPREWTDELQEDYDRIFSVGEECISGPELKKTLLAKGRGSDGSGFNLYDGFEPSGRMHMHYRRNQCDVCVLGCGLVRSHER